MKTQSRGATDLSIAVPDGTVGVRDYGGSGPPLVLIHGHCGSAADWDLVAPHLVPRFRVVALDLTLTDMCARVVFVGALLLSLLGCAEEVPHVSSPESQLRTYEVHYAVKSVQGESGSAEVSYLNPESGAHVVELVEVPWQSQTFRARHGAQLSVRASSNEIDELSCGAIAESHREGSGYESLSEPKGQCSHEVSAGS